VDQKRGELLLLIDERLDQAVLSLFDADLAFLADFLEFRDLALALLPDLENRLFQSLKILRLWLELVQELEKECFEPFLADAEPGATRAAIVGIASARPAS